MAQALVERFAQRTPALGLAAADAAAALEVDALQQPARASRSRWAPAAGRRRRRRGSRRCGSTCARQRHEARVLALEHVEALRQQHEAAAGCGPGLQRLDHGALAQRPVGEVGVAEDDLAPVLARGAGQRVAHDAAGTRGGRRRRPRAARCDASTFHSCMQPTPLRTSRSSSARAPSLAPRQIARPERAPVRQAAHQRRIAARGAKAFAVDVDMPRVVQHARAAVERHAAPGGRRARPARTTRCGLGSVSDSPSARSMRIGIAQRRQHGLAREGLQRGRHRGRRVRRRPAPGRGSARRLAGASCTARPAPRRCAPAGRRQLGAAAGARKPIE